MAKITIDEISRSLKDYLNGLGLTEAQVQELIDKFEDEKIGDISQLSTQEKGSLVGAINELFQNANNGKELIANAIGEPLSSEDTFSAMSNDINGLLSTFKTNMMNNGVTIESSDKFKQLIEKLATLSDNEGKGIQFANGFINKTGELLSSSSKSTWTTINLSYPETLSFTPTILFLVIPELRLSGSSSSGYYLAYTHVLDSQRHKGEEFGQYYRATDTNIDSSTDLYISSNSTTSITLKARKFTTNYALVCPSGIYYYAIGVGEEDTTLRDSLASILQEEGVIVTEEDDMASLISKVDEEFDRQVVPAGTAVAGDVLSGKTFINSTGNTITGGMTNNGGERTIIPSTTDQVLPDGYYSGNITVKGDSDLKPENIVEGVEIFGITGTVKKGSSQFSAMYNNDVFVPLYYTQNGVEKVLYLTDVPDTYGRDIPVKCFNDMLSNDYTTHTLLNIDRDNTHFAIDDKIYYWEATGNVNLYIHDRTTGIETNVVAYSSNYGAHQLAICVGNVIHLIGGVYWTSGSYGTQNNRNYISIFDPANNTITKVGTEPTGIHLSDGHISFKLRDSLYLIHDVNDSMYESAANFFIYDSNTYTITKITHNMTDFRGVHVARVSDTELKLCSSRTGKLYNGYLNLTDLTLNIVEVPCPLKIESIYHDAGKIFAISGGVLIHLN